MSDREVPPVGYGNPPLHTRFRKGEPQPNRRRKSSHATDVHAFFSEPVKIADGDSTLKMHPRELALTSIANAAIKGDMRKAARFLKECERAGLLTGSIDHQVWPTRLEVPIDCDPDEWLANLNKYGPPPWPLDPDGLPDLEKHRDAAR